MARVFGIDLGTTFSAIAFINEEMNKAELIRDPETQGVLTPSVVMFESADNIIVGEMAKENARAYPERTVEFVKRSMGRAKGHPPAGWQFTVGDHTYSAQEISAFILRKLQQDAQNRLGVEANQVVITVPAYFSEAQRAATAEAGRIAGLEVLAIMDEPLAAALTYGLDRADRDQRVFIFDLGGGTFDVTIVEVEGGAMRQLAIGGDPLLGGKNWDDRLIEHAAANFQQLHGSNPADDPIAYQDLQLRAVRAKEELSRRDSSPIVVQHEGQRAVVTVSRADFEGLTRDLVDRCRSLCELLMAEKQFEWSGIDTVLLVGGATRMPMIQQMMRELSGKEPSTAVNPDECVAMGAAWHALTLYHKQLPPEDREEFDAQNPGLADRLLAAPPVQKVTARELGVIAMNRDGSRRSVLIIPKFVPVPHEKTERFGTFEDGQTAIKIEVTEGGAYLSGADCDPEDCRVLGDALISDVPPSPRKSPVDVTLRFNEDGILEVTGRHVDSGRTVSARISHPGGLSDKELQAARQALQQARVSG